MKNISRIVPYGGTLLIVFFLLISVKPLFAQVETKGASVNNQDDLQRSIEIGHNLLAHPTQIQLLNSDLSNGWVIQTYLSHMWIKNAWVDYERLTNTYDENGNHTGSMSERWDTTAYKWQPVIKEAWTYDSLGVETLYSETTWNNGSPWLSQIILLYNENGYDTCDLQQNWINGAWVDNSRNVFTYDDEGNAITALSQQWKNGNWVNTTSYTATYDKDGNQTSLTIQDWYNNAWTNYGRGIYTYDENSNPATTLKQVWSSSGWVNYLQDAYTYDAHGYPDIKLEQSWTGGAWVNHIKDIYTCDAHGNTIKTMETIWKSGKWENSLWIQYTWQKLSGNLDILKPLKGETILADAPYSIRWSSSNIDSIKIEYSTDNGLTFHKITSGVAANKTGYLWHVPDTLSSKCMLRITDLNNPLEIAKSPLFRIKGYVLTRLNAKGDFELFDPALHAWQFKNDSANMWPVSWLSMFNYFLYDPYTNQKYPYYFIITPIRARSSNFVDWPLFAKTFSPGICYKNITKAVYSPTAVNLWAKYKNVTWNGSCFGFSQSCLLAFDRPDQFRLVYPEVGNFQNVHDLQLNPALRQMINQLFGNQYGRQHWVLKNTQLHTKKVRESLEELKSYFLSNDDDHRAIGIYDTISGAHSLVPYRLEKSQGDGIYHLFVYDNNNPSGNWTGGNSTFIGIDSIGNAWSYDPLHWRRLDGFGMFLRDPASQYLSWPVLWDPNPAQKNSIAKSAGYKSDAAIYLSIYNTTFSDIAITNSVGQKIGFQDSVSYNTLGDGMPLIPENSVYQPPIGYFVPEDAYSIQMSAFLDSLTDFAVLNQTAMFDFWRSDAVNNQTDRLIYDGGFGFTNPDAQTKTVNLEAINRSTDCESEFQILNCTVVQNDSVRLETPDIDRVAFVNLGPAKTYDLYIVEACTSLSGQFKHDSITVPAYSTHFIVPDLQNLSTNPVKIYEDIGNTGIISDSLFVTNLNTGLENQMDNGITGKFSLSQNYPNPFNSITTIKYSVTKPGFVSLKVFDVLGIEVASLVNEQKPAGEYIIEWNEAGLRSGIYYCRLQAGIFTDTKKLVLQK
jgi:hypothetical protein